MTTHVRADPRASPSRKRGAQPGNTNALKHGFYARAYRSGELNDLDAML